MLNQVQHDVYIVCYPELVSGSQRLTIQFLMKSYFVYIMTNKSKTLYIGVTNNLQRRVYEHKNKLIDGFTKKYNITKLVYFEETNDVNQAIRREKQLKNWKRYLEMPNPVRLDIIGNCHTELVSEYEFITFNEDAEPSSA